MRTIRFRTSTVTAKPPSTYRITIVQVRPTANTCVYYTEMVTRLYGRWHVVEIRQNCTKIRNLSCQVPWFEGECEKMKQNFRLKYQNSTNVCKCWGPFMHTQWWYTYNYIRNTKIKKLNIRKNSSFSGITVIQMYVAFITGGKFARTMY